MPIKSYYRYNATKLVVNKNTCVTTPISKVYTQQLGNYVQALGLSNKSQTIQDNSTKKTKYNDAATKDTEMLNAYNKTAIKR